MRGGLAAERGERDLGGVEELGAAGAVDCADEHAVGGAGDEVADVFIPAERGHGVAVEMGGLAGGGGSVPAFGQFPLEDGVPGGEAAGDGGVCGDGDVVDSGIAVSPLAGGRGALRAGRVSAT